MKFKLGLYKVIILSKYIGIVLALSTYLLLG